MAKTMNLGKVAMTTAGAYDSSKSYERLTCVTHNHVSWISRKDVPAGVAPGTSEVYWQRVAERGEQGIQGPVGPQGNSAFDGNGVEIVNNLTQGGEAAVLSAEQGKILDTKLAKVSAGIAPFVQNVETNVIDDSLISGAVYNGAIRSYGFRTEPIDFKKGDYVVAENFNGTASYDFAAQYKDGVYTTLYRPSVSGNQGFELYLEEDMSIVFSTMYNSKSATLRTIDSKVLNEVNTIKDKPNKSDLDFFGFGIDEQNSMYNFNRVISLKNFELKKGASFIAQMGEELYYGYTNEQDNMTLEVNGTGKKKLYLNGTPFGAKYSWNKGDLLFVYYDGEVFQATGLNGNNKANSLWNDVIGASVKDIYAESTPMDFNVTGYAACKIDVQKNDILYINTDSTGGINLISQITDDGGINVLENGKANYKGYRIGEFGYIYICPQDMSLRVVYKTSNEPIMLLFKSFVVDFISKTSVSIKSLEELTKPISPTIVLNLDSLFINGAIYNGAVQTYGYRTEPLELKKGDYVVVQNLYSTPAYELASQWKDGVYVKNIYRQSVSGEYDFELYLEEDADIVFCSASNRSNASVDVYRGEGYRNILQQHTKEIITLRETKADKAELEQKVSQSDFEAEKQTREKAESDLQEQINKLDFSGDIEQVVRDYIDEHPESVTSVPDNSISEAKFTENVRLKKASVYANVETMVADTTLEVGMTAITKGYYAEGDGGGGQYTIVEPKSENGGSYISLKNGKTASLVFDGKTYILSQWGVRGDGVIRTARSVYPFLTTSAIKEVNSLFDDSVTDAAFMIQYLINRSAYKNGEIVVDGRYYNISHSIKVASCVTISGVNTGASRTEWINRVNTLTSYCRSSLVMTNVNTPMFISENYDGEGNAVVQHLCMKNFNARGTLGLVDGVPGNFFDSTRMTITRCLFENLSLCGFSSAFHLVEECYWTIFNRLQLFKMQNNGIDFQYRSGVVTGGQKNANTITECIICGCGMDYDFASGEYINKYGAESNVANVLPIDQPTPSRGNCIVISNSGNYVANCDLTDAAVGVYRSEQSQGTTIVGLYSENISMCQVYNNYTEGNEQSAELGGYLRPDKWKTSKGVEKSNKRVANPIDFVVE